MPVAKLLALENEVPNSGSASASAPAAYGRGLTSEVEIVAGLEAEARKEILSLREDNADEPAQHVQKQDHNQLQLPTLLANDVRAASTSGGKVSTDSATATVCDTAFNANANIRSNKCDDRNDNALARPKAKPPAPTPPVQFLRLARARATHADATQDAVRSREHVLPAAFGSGAYGGFVNDACESQSLGSASGAFLDAESTGGTQRGGYGYDYATGKPLHATSKSNFKSNSNSSANSRRPSQRSVRTDRTSFRSVRSYRTARQPSKHSQCSVVVSDADALSPSSSTYSQYSDDDSVALADADERQLQRYMARDARLANVYLGVIIASFALLCVMTLLLFLMLYGEELGLEFIVDELGLHDVRTALLSTRR